MKTGASHFRHQRPGRGGFTLLEVLATMMLIAIVLPTTMKAISLCTAAAGVARSVDEAARLGDSKLNELATSPSLATGSQSGDFAPDYPDYRWTAQITERDTDLLEIAVQVTWTERGQERQVTLTTLQYTGGTL